MKVVFRVNEDAESFDAYVRSHPQGSMYQSCGWSLIKREWDSLRLVGESDGRIVCSALILIRRFPLGQKLFYIPRGPLWSDDAVAREFFDYIKQTAKKQGAFCVKFDPKVVFRQFDTQKIIDSMSDEVIQHFLNLDKDVIHKGFEQGLNTYAQPRYNAIVLASEDMFERFSSSTKRNIKTALKKNVSVDRFSDEKITSFSRLMSLTEQRKSVSLRNMDYFKRFFGAFDKQASLFIAQVNLRENLLECQQQIRQLSASLDKALSQSNAVKQQRVQLDALIKEQEFYQRMKEKHGDVADVSGLLILIHGSVCEFLYSGMDADFSKLYPAYLMRYRAMEYACQQGCSILNFGGIAGTLDDGLWEFKRSFGSIVTEYIGEFDMIVRPNIYRLFESGLPIARRMMHRIKRLRGKEAL